MAEFKWFKSLNTGKVGKYPAHYGERPSFVEVDPDAAECIECKGIQIPEEEEVDILDDIEPFEVEDDLDDYEVDDLYDIKED